MTAALVYVPTDFVPTLLLARMYFLMADREESFLSFRAVTAAMTICP